MDLFTFQVGQGVRKNVEARPGSRIASPDESLHRDAIFGDVDQASRERKRGDAAWKSGRIYIPQPFGKIKGKWETKRDESDDIHGFFRGLSKEKALFRGVQNAYI